MSFGTSPHDNLNVPLGSVYTPNTVNSDPTMLEGGPISTDSNSQKSAPVSTYIKDGSNLVEGVTTDAAVTGDTTGTISAKLRGLSKMWFDMWDSTNHWLQVKVMNSVALGQSVMSNSSPVVIASDQSSISVKAGYTEVTGLSAGSLNADLVPSTDVSAYKWLSLQLNGSYSGTLTFQCSNDNSTWTSIFLQNAAITNYSTTTTFNNTLFFGPVNYRYLRVRMTAYTSGTCTGVLELYTQVGATNFMGIGSNGSSITFSSTDFIVFSSAAYTTTQTQADQISAGARGIRVVLDVTNAGTGSVTLEIDAKDTASGKYLPLLMGAAVITTSTNVYEVYPGLTPVANTVVSDVLSRTWRIRVTANNANTVTYSVGASYLL